MGLLNCTNNFDFVGPNTVFQNLEKFIWVIQPRMGPQRCRWSYLSCYLLRSLLLILGLKSIRLLRSPLTFPACSFGCGDLQENIVGECSMGENWSA